MLTVKSDTNIYAYLKSVDMRKSIDGLAAKVNDEFDIPLQSGCIFVFHNKARDKVKILFWEKNGFVLYYKRLERGRFKFNKSAKSLSIELSPEQLNWLLAGLDFTVMQQFSELDYSQYY